MLRPVTFTLLGVLALAGPARSQGPPARPETFPPIPAMVTFKDGELVIQTIVIQFKTEKREYEAKGPDGKLIKKQFEVTHPVEVTENQKADAKQSKLYRVNGKVIDPKDYPTVLAKPTPVFLAADFKEVDPFYLQFLADDTLILIRPKMIAVPVPASGSAARPRVSQTSEKEGRS